LLFGVAEDHDSNPIKLGISKLKARGREGRQRSTRCARATAIADDWIGITPGTDGLLVLALIHELLKAGEDRRRLPRALLERALARHRRAGNGRARPVRARCGRKAVGLGSVRAKGPCRTDREGRTRPR
jgi:anaerobic selenocysteine-containing dehydrogenase